jgi:hypothetical protein
VPFFDATTSYYGSTSDCTQVNYDNDVQWHQWNMTAKTRLMIENHPKPWSNKSSRQPDPPKHEIRVPFSPALAESEKHAKLHVIPPQESLPESPHRGDGLDLFSAAMEADDYAAVPIFDDDAPRLSHPFMDCEDHLSESPHTGDGLDLFSTAMEADDYAAVPIFDDDAPRPSHPSTDDGNNLSVPTKKEV